nr:MAG TPA: hypothetical protein [Bacteriophage sp.]
MSEHLEKRPWTLRFQNSSIQSIQNLIKTKIQAREWRVQSFDQSIRLSGSLDWI